MMAGVGEKVDSPVIIVNMVKRAWERAPARRAGACMITHELRLVLV